MITKEQLEEINVDFNMFIHLFFDTTSGKISEEENNKLIEWFNKGKRKLINLQNLV